MKPASLEKVKAAISQGLTNATWTWEKLGLDVLAEEGVQVGERGKECVEHAARVLRGYYPNRQKVWDAEFVNATEEVRQLQYEHIVNIYVMEAEFTLSKRPIPPKPEPKAAAPTPPPPPGAAPAPPAPPAPPPPPPQA